MNELGKLGNLHFIDLNRDVQPYMLVHTANLKNIEETERKIM